MDAIIQHAWVGNREDTTCLTYLVIIVGSSFIPRIIAKSVLEVLMYFREVHNGVHSGECLHNSQTVSKEAKQKLTVMLRHKPYKRFSVEY
jgi:hypothetical protein